MGGGDQMQSYATQIIGGDGTFNIDEVENFVKNIKLNECGLSYAVVSIMGPQSSGKSTLINHLFGTEFKVMDESTGRSQTTQGIWIANCVGIEPCTIVMDVEGSDGQERGQDDTTFEKQSSLFALVVSDVIMVNMWCTDIGREQAACKPLLRIVFKAMLKLSSSPRKRTLMFVIRDHVPLAALEQQLRKNIEEIWISSFDTQAHNFSTVDEYFNVEVVSLSHYVYLKKEFMEQVAQLRQRFFGSISPGGLAGDRRGINPGSGFSASADLLWKQIKENKDLDLPSHKVMLATVRCEETALEKYHVFEANEIWCRMKESVLLGPVPSFGKTINSLFEASLLQYDEDTLGYVDHIRAAKRQELLEKLKLLVQPSFELMLKQIGLQALDDFKGKIKEALDKNISLNESVDKGMSLIDAVTLPRSAVLDKFDKECSDLANGIARWDTAKAKDTIESLINEYVAFTEEALAEKEKIAIMEKERARFELEKQEAQVMLEKVIKEKRRS